VECVEHCCEIWTDHKNLQYFMMAKKLNRRQARWSLLLAQFDFVMHHRPGKSMGKMDALSHRSDHGTGSEDNDNMVLLTPSFFTVRELEGLEAAEEERGILEDIRKGTQDGEKEEPVARAARELQGSSAHSVKSAELSWSVLGHILSKEQSKDGSDGASNDGRLTIVQCHHYHRPPSSDLYRSSVGILPPLRYHQHNLHSYHCHYQPAPCAFYRSTTTAPPCSTHVPCSRPITLCMHQFSRS